MMRLSDFNRSITKRRKHSWDISHYKKVFKKNSKEIITLMNNELQNFKKKVNKESKIVEKEINLNIFNILNTCISEDYYNELEFKNQKKDSFSKIKNPKHKKGKEINLKNNNIINNNSNIIKLCSEIFNDDSKLKLMTTPSINSKNQIKSKGDSMPKYKIINNKNKINLKRKSLDISNFNHRIRRSLRNRFQFRKKTFNDNKKNNNNIQKQNLFLK